MKAQGLLPIDRYLDTLRIVQKEGIHLSYSWQRLFSRVIDAAWVQALDNKPELAEQLEAFVSRFGRMQDTIADKLLPRWLQAQAENAGSQIEVLNRAERLGVVSNVEYWLEARKLRNRLIHEYIEAPQDFADDLNLAKEYTQMLVATYNQLQAYTANRMSIEAQNMPYALDELPSNKGQ